MSRNRTRKIKNIKLNQYDFLSKNRNTKRVNIYSGDFLSYPDENTKRSLSYKEHYWSNSDRFFKLSYQYYGNKEDWWVIARFNGKPTEADMKLGDRILIPFPLEIVKDFIGYLYNCEIFIMLIN